MLLPVWDVVLQDTRVTTGPDKLNGGALHLHRIDHGIGRIEDHATGQEHIRYGGIALVGRAPVPSASGVRLCHCGITVNAGRIAVLSLGWPDAFRKHGIHLQFETSLTHSAITAMGED